MAKYKLVFYNKPGGKQIEEIIESTHEESIVTTIENILDIDCEDPERMYNLYDADGQLILSDEILEL